MLMPNVFTVNRMVKRSLNKMSLMTKLIILLVTTIFSASMLYGQAALNQTDSNGLKAGRWITRYPGGSIRYEGSFANGQPVGEWKRFHENGKMKAHIIHLPNSDKSTAELFDGDGIRYAKGNYKGTLKDSTWNYYNNLQLIGKENYANGVKNGQSVTFFANGTPSTESNWSNGTMEGVCRSFYPSGKKMSETMYHQGKRDGLSLIYYESGIPQITGQYKNDQSDGEWKFTDERGKVKYDLKYQSGVLLNPGILDSIQENDFKAFDRAKGKLKDPANFTQNPEEYMRN